MLLPRIAFRNVFRHRSRSLLTGLMMAGGCVLFSAFIGIIDGTYANLIDMFTRDHTGHIQIHKGSYLDRPSIYKIIADPESVGGRVAALPHVESWTPRIHSPALAFAGTKTSGIELVGIDPRREARTTRIRHKVQQGRFLSEEPSNEIIISRRLARVLKLGPGDEVALIAQGVDGSIANDLFTVTGITDAEQLSYGGTRCYIHIDRAREFLAMNGGAHEIAVVLTDQGRTLETAERIREVLHDDTLSVDPWHVVEAQFYRAMQADIKGNWITIVVFTVIIAVGVLNTVLMVILERTREFGVMKAMGTRPGQLFALIVMETAFLALISIAAGIPLGLAANWILSVHGIKMSDPVEWGGFIFDTMTARITFRTVVIPAAVIMGTAMIVSIPPAFRAARIEAVKALRSS